MQNNKKRKIQQLAYTIVFFFIGLICSLIVYHFIDRNYKSARNTIANHEFLVCNNEATYLSGKYRNNAVFDLPHDKVGKIIIQDIGRSSLLTTPVENGDALFFGDGNFIRSVHKKTYKENWNVRTNAKIAGTPCIICGHVYASNELGFVFSIDELTGNISWIFKLPKGVYGSPLIKDNKIILGCWDQHVYCIDRMKCKVIWKYKTGAAVNSTAALKDDKVFICSDKLYCLNFNTGNAVWSIPSKKWNMIGSPTVFGDFVVVGRSPRSSILVSIESGKVYWDAPVGDNVTSLVVCPNLIIGSNCYAELFALTHYGELKWKILLSTKSSSTPLIINKKVFVGDDNGFIYEVDLENGQLLAKYTTDCGEVETAGFFTTGIIFATTSGKYVQIPLLEQHNLDVNELEYSTSVTSQK